MKLPWSKKQPQTRGPYKKITQADKLREAKAEIDVRLARTFLDDLKSHPTFAIQLARQRFGMLPEPEMPDGYLSQGGAESPDLLEILRQAKEARDLIKDSFPENESKWGVVSDILKALPQGLAALQSLQPQQPERVYVERPVPTPRPQPVQPQQIQRPEPKVIEERVTRDQLRPVPESEPKPDEGQSFTYQPDPEIKTGQAKAEPVTEKEPTEEDFKVFIENLLSMPPEQAAAQLYLGKDVEGDVRSMIFSYLVEADIDSICEQIPSVVESLPVLRPLADRLLTSAGRSWLALVLDELTLLATGEKSVDDVRNGDENEVDVE